MTLTLTPTQEKLIQQFNKNIAWLKEKERKQYISENEAMRIFGVGKSRLRQLRNTHKVLRKWKSKNGRRIEYDMQELERYFNKQQ